MAGPYATHPNIEVILHIHMTTDGGAVTDDKPTTTKAQIDFNSIHYIVTDGWFFYEPFHNSTTPRYMILVQYIVCYILYFAFNESNFPCVCWQQLCKGPQRWPAVFAKTMDGKFEFYTNKICIEQIYTCAKIKFVIQYLNKAIVIATENLLYDC